MFCIFHVSDGTGITAETLGRALTSQYPGIEARRVTLPFVRDAATARATVARIQREAADSGCHPVILATLLDEDIRAVFREAGLPLLDFFEHFAGPARELFGEGAAAEVGRSHGVSDAASYDRRIRAVDYALGHDDGVSTTSYDDADVILAGVSRAGKTPTCLYLALQHGLRAANYPFTDDDLESDRLPAVLRDNRDRVFGLTIEARRLAAIREERRPGSRYASVGQCRQEVRQVESLFRRERIPCVDVTPMSVEEIAASVRAHLQPG